MFHFFGKTRFLILALNVACLSLITANLLSINFTVICMAKDTVPSVDRNNTNATDLYTPAQQSLLFSAPVVGQLLGTVPVASVMSLIGFRYTMTIFAMLNAISTLLIPFCVNAGFYATVAIRILQGLVIPALWLGTGGVTEIWSPPQNFGIFLTLMSCSDQFGPMIVMPLAGAICASSSWEWPMVYYILGGLTIVFFVIFFIFYSDSPQDHRCVSAQELAVIKSDKATKNEAQPQKVPHLTIVSDIVVWALILYFITSTMGIMLISQYGPVFLNKALGEDMSSTGVDVALPFLLGAVLKIISGSLSDGLKCISERAKVQLFGSASQYIMALCFLLLGLLPKLGFTNVMLFQACYTGATAANVLCIVGVNKSTQFVAGPFVHVIYSWVSVLSSVSWLIAPSMIALLTPTNSLDEWSLVFIFAAVIVAGGTVLFNCTATVEPRPWSMETYRTKSIGKNTVAVADECP